MKAKIVQSVDGMLIASVVEAENIIPAMEVRNARFTGVKRDRLGARYPLRKELIGQPMFDTFCGPMYDEIDGQPAIRYEDNEANERLSL